MRGVTLVFAAVAMALAFIVCSGGDLGTLTAVRTLAVAVALLAVAVVAAL